MLPHTLRQFFSTTALTIQGSCFEKHRNCFLLMSHSTAVQSPFHTHLTPLHKLSQTPTLVKRDLVGICSFFVKKEQKTWKERRGVALLCEVGGRGGRCSLLMFLFQFSKVCTEKQFQEKVLTCPGNLPVSRDQWLLPFSFPPLPPSSCCFCPPIYLLLVYTFQLLFSARSSFPALSVLLHPATPPNTFFTKQFFLLEKPDAFYSEVQYLDGRVWSHAVKDNHSYHTYIHNPITHKPIWTASCPI